MMTLDQQLALEAKRQQDLAKYQEAYENIKRTNPQNKEAITRTMRQQMALTKPRTNKELWQKIRAVYGVALPWRATAPGMASPFEQFSDIYFGRSPMSLTLAGRGTGKTYGFAILENEMMADNPNWETAHAGATRNQADVLQRYLGDFTADPILGSRFKKGSVGKTRARYINGSRWLIATGSMKGISGNHSNSLVLDELEFWEIAGLEQTWAVPMERDGYDFCIWAGASTRQRSAGAMNWLTDNADEKGLKMYTWTPFEVMEPCVTCRVEEQAKYGSEEEKEKACPLWKWCHGERARKSTGWMRLDAVIKLKKSMTERSWESQAMCLKPSAGGLVLHNFERELRAAGGNLMKWRYQSDLPWYVAHDPAEGKKSCMFFFQIFQGCTFVFDEIVDPASSSVIVDKKALNEYCLKNAMPKPTYIIVDPRRTDAVATWKDKDAAGVSYNAVTPSIEAQWGGGSIDQTLEFLREDIERKRFYVNPDTCSALIMAIREHSYPTDMSGNVTSDVPQKAYKDEVDTIRYLTMFKRERLVRQTTGGILLL